MTDDLMIFNARANNDAKNEAMEKVEQAFKEVRGTTIEEFSANNDFDLGGNDDWF